MECEVTVPIHIHGPLNIIEVDALLDSGTTGCFVDKSWALERCLKLSKLVKPIPVLNIDGTRNQEGDIMHYVLLTIHVGKHAEKLWCAVTCLGKMLLILGHTWLKKHNPNIDWTTGSVNLNRCLLRPCPTPGLIRLLRSHCSSTAQLRSRITYSGHGRADIPLLSTTLGLVPTQSLLHLTVYPALT